MTTFDVTNRRLPFLRDFSTKDRELAEKTARQQEARQRQAHEARAKKLEAALEDHRRRLHDLLGARKDEAVAAQRASAGLGDRHTR